MFVKLLFSLSFLIHNREKSTKLHLNSARYFNSWILWTIYCDIIGKIQQEVKGIDNNTQIV